MATIAELIERNREPLIARFIEETRRRASAQALTREEIIDTLPEYLDALIALSRDWRREEAASKKHRLEAIHIGHRLRVGYNQEEVTAEYRLLGRLLSALWEPLSPEEQPAPADTRQLSAVVQEAMEHVVTLFSDHTVEERQAERRREGHLRGVGEERWRLIIETTGMGTWDYDLRTGEARFDERTKALFGLPADASVSRGDLVERVHPDDRERIRLAILQAMQPGGRGTYSLEYRTVELPGVGTRWIAAHGRTLFDASGLPVRFLGTVTDVTERVREREAIQQERLRVTNILESISDAFFGFDKQWHITYANREAERLLGRPRESLLGRDHWEVFPETLGTALEHHYRRAMEERVAVTFENFYIPWKRWFELRVYPMEEGLAVYFHDITQKKQHEAEREALLREQVRLREEAEQSLRERQRAVEVLEHGDPVAVLDKDFRFILVNENQEHISRMRRQDTLGRDFWEVFPSVASPASKFWTEFHRVVEQRVPVRFDEHYGPLDMWTSVSAYPTSEGGVAAFYRDITEQKRAEQFRERLLGIVSHDLRNPLGNISVTAQLLLGREEVPEGVLAGVRRIAASAERMQRMISDLLDFTQATMGGGIPLERRPTELCELVRATLEELEPLHPGRVVQRCARGLSEGEWDPDRLAQVVSNLVSNALAYGEEDKPVEVRVWEEGADNVLSVHNRGRPIPAEQLPRVFDPFRRATRDGNRKGLGLGLYIVQQVVRAHGGTISVSSSEEEGTTFTVRLPRTPSPSGRGPG